ncbi:MAG: DDE-type integrase/transposase/recombinase [Candidatus Pacearchaeota archaeon]
MISNNIICPKCKSTEVIKWGKRKTENRGKVQRYCCKSCSETFINDSFARMRNSPQKITCALDLFYRGLSTRGVQEHFKAFFPHNSNHTTILRWVRKYSLQISNFTDTLNVQTGSYIEVDEMEYHRRKSYNKKLGVDRNWFIDGIDVKTRFILSSAYVKNRNQKELKAIFETIKGKTGEQVKIVTTDGLTQYPNVVKSVYGYYNLKKGLVTHRVVNASKGQGFNIWVERLHNTIRQRTQNFRGFHGSVESAYSLMKGFEIYYNFIKKHESLNYKTPSDVTIPSLKFETANRWLELIQISKN